jgi:Flp pilus assembly protein TadG
MRREKQKGQAILMVVVASGLFLIGVLGLVMDGAQIYTNRQMAQDAADAAAQAGIMSMFNGTNTGTNAFGSAAHTCTTSDVITPCVYARNNGFGNTAADTVVVDFSPGQFTAADVGVTAGSLSGSDPQNIIRVTINRSLNTGIMRLLGTTIVPVKAIAAAAIVELASPVPLIVLHPTLTQSFAVNGGAGTGKWPIKICGGPTRSIQVNSKDLGSIIISGGSTVDLSHAGPADPGNCSVGTGADFGDYGGPNPYPGGLSLGSTGHYIQPAAPILDPLYYGSSSPPLVPTPTAPSPAVAPASVPAGVNGCPAAWAPCTLFQPGLYTSQLQVKNTFALFAPGLYYISSGGLSFESNSGAAIATGIAAPTGFTSGPGVLFFVTGNSTGDVFNFSSNAGSKGGITLVGSDAASQYKNVLFYSDRASTVTKIHTLQGGGTISLTGTIYATSTPNITAALYQKLDLQGTPGSGTLIQGEILVDVINIGGTANVTMNLNPFSSVKVRQVALVK